MAQYDNLPVYKATYDLLLSLFKASLNWQREFRYTLGEKLKEELTEMLLLVYRANASHDKAGYIAEAREMAELVKLNLRLLHDLKQINSKQYMGYAEMTENISKQLALWHKYITEKEKK